MRMLREMLGRGWFFILSVYLSIHCIFTILPWTFAKSQAVTGDPGAVVILEPVILIRVLFVLTGLFGLGLIPQMVLVYRSQQILTARWLLASAEFCAVFVISSFVSRLRNLFPLSQYSWTRLVIFTWLPFVIFMRLCSLLYREQKKHIYHERHAD
jgi:hypothetical protein